MTSEAVHVEVPSTANPLSPDQMVQLKHAVDPLTQCEDLGISLVC